jgi:hypothetical protein
MRSIVLRVAIAASAPVPIAGMSTVAVARH